MAETKKAVVDIEVDSGNAVNSLKAIKAELKAAQSAALAGNQDAAKKVAELKDKLDDLKDSTKSLQGSGVEKVTSSFGLLGEGLRNFDFDKIKIGFKGIGTAMSAIPVFLIAEGISYLVENFKELSEGNGVLAKSLQGISWLFNKITEEIYAVTDALGLTNSELDKQGEAIKGFADKTKEALSSTIAEYDRQIKVAKANGQETIDIERKKQEAIIQTNVTIAKQIEAFVRAGGVLDDEKKKLLTASLEAIKNAKTDEIVIEAEHTKKINEEYKKGSDDKQKKMDDDFAAALAQGEKEEAERNRLLEIDKKNQKEKEAEDERIRQAAKKVDDEIRAQSLADDRAANKEKEDAWKKEKDDRIAAQEAVFKNAQLLTQNLQAISDVAFSFKMAKVKKGSAEEEALMKKQFEINKKLQIAQTTITTIQSARNAYNSLSAIPYVGVPLGIAAAAAATLAGLAAIQQIKGTSFGGGGSISGGGESAPNISGGGSTSAPTTSAPTTNSQPFTRLDESGRNQGLPTIKAYVVESEMTDKQKRVGKLEGQASFG